MNDSQAPICEAIVPAQMWPTSTEETLRDAEGDEYTRTVAGERYEPEHPCGAPATVRARSMEERACDLYDQLEHPADGLHWLVTGERLTCQAHFMPPTMTHRDGRITQGGAEPISGSVA